MQPKRPSSSRDLEPSPMADISLSLRTAFMDNTHYRRESDSLSTSALSSASGSPTSSPGSSWPFRKHRFSGSNNTHSRDRSRSPFANIIPFSFRRSSPFFLRRRPSAVDLALSEERSRCDEDSIERVGLSLMEPRPVDPIPIAMDLNAHVLEDMTSKRSSWTQSSQCSVLNPQQPRYVMGGIVEVMEGNA
ncbi:hypothetical protein BGW36DRAFT_295474 [Talaromyces proteolyticus]|uniref:Uncharacterized protein n=1 Tax=Talaromyces proteolyticus TaxID=1131652 RepID=A0AAD4KPB2_9EURO|nr:uncharacterized protein BGW36DRAFT_295474 [Talaromyces proteolyticus]KAH8697358.1 hypothetical protein BGW36DRAFT_295474 [Talaromyces proteolyticus]